MMFNRMMVIWFVIPMIIALIIGTPWFIWRHFPSVRTTCKTMCLVVIRRRATPVSWKNTRDRVKNFHTTKIAPRLEKARLWMWAKTKKHFARSVLLCIMAAFGAAVILIGWWGVVIILDNPHTLMFGSKTDPNTKNVAWFLLVAIATVIGILVLTTAFYFIKNRVRVIKSAAGGTWKLVTGTKEFLKFFALSAVWWVVVGTFAYLQKEFPTPWEFLWEKHQSLTIITSVLLLVWSSLWFFRENSKPISWSVKIVSILLIALWVNTAWNTETVKNFRGDGVSWTRGISSGSSRGPSAYQLITDDTPSYKFTVNLAPGESYYVRPFMVSQDDWSRTIRLYPGVKLRIVYGGTVTVQLKEKDQFWFVEDGPKEKTSLNKRRVTGLNGEDTFIDVDPDRISFRARGEDKHVQIHMIRTN